MDIKRLIGEATEYDKKEMLEYKKPKSWLKSVSAFANGMGGKLLFGIDDDGEVVGLADYEKDCEVISETIKTKMDPIPEIHLVPETVDGMKIIVLTVFPGKETPYYYVGDDDNEKNDDNSCDNKGTHNFSSLKFNYRPFYSICRKSCFSNK